MTHYEKLPRKWQVGLRVSIIDTSDHFDKPTKIYGEVVEVGDETVEIQWEDLGDWPTEYNISDMGKVSIET